MTTWEQAQFLDGVARSAALDGNQLLQIQELARSVSPDPRYLGGELLRRGWMTAFQINQINRGQSAALHLGPYLLLDRIGRGSMGEVFKARHLRMGRLAAIKAIRQDRRESPRALARFEREVQSVSRFDHPNIVHAYDAGTSDDGTFFLAMEYLEGADLKQLVRQHGPLSVRQASDFTCQVAWALQHAFERHVIHRDIKPANLFLVSRGQVIKVLDMGLARLKDQASDLTRPRMSLGTADFEAPEQFSDPHAADIRSDLYSLGCTLYFLLTGAPPFTRATAVQRMLAHVLSKAEPVESLRPDVPAALAAVVRRLMAKRPERRYQAPLELALDLTELLQSGALPEGPPSPESGAAADVDRHGAFPPDTPLSSDGTPP
jgi:serine/threonine-protein kinase